ncbi:MAG: menaquinone biosynthesis protein [bacterium]|nr:menaquinone biosynthesis protein [bacterium]
MPALPRLRVGSVPYLVGRPLDYGLEHEAGIDFRREVPARLVERLRSGELDVALVSSIELFRGQDYRYLDELAVAGLGSVASVQVFLRKPLAAVESVALDPSSRTAATLTRVLLADREGGPPAYVEVAPGADPRAARADAWLRIGDPALREYLVPDAPPVFNPSAAWSERTGMPFVFACWIVRADVAIEPYADIFVQARARGTARIEELAAQASDEWGLPHGACLEYLSKECLYDPGEAMTPALLAFQKAAAEQGLCRGDVTPPRIALPHAHA